MSNVRVGLVGYGYAGRTFHAPLIRATPGMQLVAVASTDAAKVHAELGAAVDVLPWAELIGRPDVELVVIATPNALHHPQALAALACGRHVVVDKPMALDAREAAELAAAAHAAGRLLSVFHNRRWDGDFLTVARLLHEGRLGRVVEAELHFDRFRPVVRDRWREGDGPGAGLWLDLGPHLVDQAVQLFGRPDAIALDRAMLRDGARADDWFDARLRWTSAAHAGLRVRLHASTLAAEPGPRFLLHGTAGSCRIDGLDPQEEALKRGEPIDAAGWGRDTRVATLWLADRSETQPLVAGAYPAYYAAVRDALRRSGPVPVTAAEALQVQCLLDSGRHSARQRRELAVH
jgi:predicted dehydrogenase